MSAPILGSHPTPPHPFGLVLAGADRETVTRVPHRVLCERDGDRDATAAALRDVLVRHHTDPEALKRSREHREALRRLGFGAEAAGLRRFPASDTTRKGNLAEIVLAEYVVASSGLNLPVYRLRYNPNTEQSMKGDDVLAFDLDARPVRVIVGEAKFRAASTAAAVTEIVEALVRSHRGGIPTSLQFVADRLFESAQMELGQRVLECAKLFALGRLRLDYVGLLMGDSRAAERVDASTPSSLRRLAMISFGVFDPNAFVHACFEGLE